MKNHTWDMGRKYTVTETNEAGEDRVFISSHNLLRTIEAAKNCCSDDTVKINVWHASGTDRTFIRTEHGWHEL